VDRNGEHFGHVLEYMRDGVVSAVEDDAEPSVVLLHALKREFEFYSIELWTIPDQPEPEMAFVIGGRGDVGTRSCMEQCDASSGRWSAAAAMGTRR
jgi:hypothetical protein